MVQLKKMRSCFIITFSLGMYFTGSLFGQNKIFVSTKGNDHAAGTLDQPMATLHQAMLLAQKFPGAKTNIYFREGIYYPDTTIVLNVAALNGKTILISAFRNEAVTISAAKSIAVSWKKFTQFIYSVKIALAFETDALFINGNNCVMARYPNYDSSAGVFNGTAADAISEEMVKRWSNPMGGFFHALHAGEWGSFHYRLTGKDDQGKLTMEGGWQNNRPSPLHKEFRFVENIMEELDAPGEWYYNKNEQTLYYYPKNEQEISVGRVELSRLKTLIYLKGDELNPVKNISITKIKFTQTKRVLMETHEPLLRSDWMLHRAGAVMLEGTENCKISECIFDQLGATAIMVSGFNSKVTIDNNHIANAGGSGICFVGDVAAVRSPAFRYEQFLPYELIDKTPGPKNKFYPKNCLVYNNLVHDIGRIEKQATGVEISMSENITVKNNTIYNTPRAGINIGDGTWGGHIIEYNAVFNTVLETGDHGAFNSWGRDRYWNADRKYMDSITNLHPEIILLDAQKTTVIRNNLFRCDHGWDIDLDDGSSNYHIYNNICLNGGIKLREGFYRTVENNIMINNSFHPHVWFANSGDVFRKNIVTRNYYPIAVPHWGKEVNHNFFPDSLSLREAQKNKTDQNSLYGNPLFLNAGAGNYRLAENSPALATGFKNIAMQNIGVNNPHLRSMALKVKIPALMLRASVNNNKDNIPIKWLDVLMRNVNGMGDRSAYGLASEHGVIIISVKEAPGIVKSGLIRGDVIVDAVGKQIKDIYELMNQYQLANWTGKMTITVMRNQQLKSIVLKLK